MFSWRTGLVLMLCTSYTIQSNALSVKNSPVPGGVAVVPLEIADDQPRPTVKLNDHRVLVTKHSAHPDRWTAIVGVPLDYKDKQIEISVKPYYKNSYTQKFDVSSKAYPSESITIKNRKHVAPPPEIVERIKSERETLNLVLSTWKHEDLQHLDFVMPVSGRMSGVFGSRRIINKQPRNPHKGIDIAAPIGTPIIAAEEGVVSFVGDLFYTGHTVIVDHGQGLQSIYCHLNSVDVKKGHWLTKGEQLGKVGKTGRATGPHLHFGMNLNNTRIDPLLFLTS